MTKMEAFVRTSSVNDRIELVKVDIPSIANDEVLVEVKAFGVGIHDRYFIPQNITFPYPVGSEATGVISEIGSNVTDVRIGDKVILSSSLQPKGGCWAKYVAVSPNMLVNLPNIMDFTVGAALPIAGKTALECMNALNLKKGNSLFVAGSSGAIGTLIIQLAKKKEIRVVGSASSKNHEYMLSLGAEKAVDYTSPHWKKDIKRWMPGGVDAALAIIPGVGVDVMEVVKDGGKVITVSGDRFDAVRNINVEQFQHKLNFKQAIESLVADIASGNIHVEIEHIYPFEQAIDALTKTETRHARGKLVVTV